MCKKIFSKGKTKTLYCTEHVDFLIMKFRDDISSKNGKNCSSIKQKGDVNNQLNYFIMNYLSKNDIPVHVIKLINKNQVLVKKLTMFPIEFVIRNRVAGSLSKRLHLEEGNIIKPQIFELFLKNDKKNDPMINESYCEAFGWISKQHLEKIYILLKNINNILIKLFSKVQLILVDFKLEFGLFKNNLTLGDEISLDCMRIWDKKTLKKMDKDRFRKNLNNIIESYKEVNQRLGIYDF
ncbi:phosphoribosylaminoimidazolesuccinocarboxamide synthase [Candidatus Tachikawaea gelatinosa]|uniref:Phosphoribosylaminoimidazole-succinocarboxamide synthase n=1 Tax=Candidatus Tachikawaea gelatinosa TaxID=1410383 RepID=A0A090AMJ6_9ENTR|nr:phosphoribosylaminoimidazolesuccinocarboxamide synthase [Candidatus Tachikawaea gelatinosa]BAP58819.1 phosphoribosylaminoimidazole-succinocarboxamide synthase [Candidatus Tachikawaea gelatinosa]